IPVGRSGGLVQVALRIVRAWSAPVRIAVAITVVGMLAGVAASVSAATLPSCRTGDALTQYRTTRDWNRSVLDTWYRLSSGYVPPDLRSTSYAGLNGGFVVRSFVVADLRAMASAARSAGARLAVESAYRSYTTQS